MTRRILLALVALTVSVLVAAVIPLGLRAEGYQRRSYMDDARAVARAAASVAEEQLADGRPSPEMNHVLAHARRDGDTLLITDARGRLIASAGPAQGVARRLIDDAAGSVSRDDLDIEVGRGYVGVVVPVRDGETAVGTVTLARPLGPLDHGINAMWLTLAAIALAAIAAATVIAFALARWVSGPLAELDASARRLGTGDLQARAGAGAGPPQLRRLAVTFNAMAARIEALVHRQRAMVADVSHQLRTPLAALRLRFDLLAQDTDPATAAELAGALDEFTRLSRLVDGLLAVARAENTVPEPVAVDVGEVIAERVAAWQPVADDRGVHLAADVPRPAGGGPAAEATPGSGARPASGRPTDLGAEPVVAALGDGHLEQILDNLLANALDATSAGDHITVHARVVRPDPSRPETLAWAGEAAVSGLLLAGGGLPAVPGGDGPASPTGPARNGDTNGAGGTAGPGAGDRPSLETLGGAQPVTKAVVRLVVADDGPGMSPQDRARAFGRFTTASPRGSGLGLAIVHRLVTSNQGTARLEETPGGGLSAVLEFPWTRKTVAEPPDRTGGTAHLTTG